LTATWVDGGSEVVLNGDERTSGFQKPGNKNKQGVDAMASRGWLKNEKGGQSLWVHRTSWEGVKGDQTNGKKNKNDAAVCTGTELWGGPRRPGTWQCSGKCDKKGKPSFHLKRLEGGGGGRGGSPGRNRKGEGEERPPFSSQL